MDKTMIEEKLEMEMKPFNELCEKITRMTEHDLESDIEDKSAEIIGKQIDMIKDLCEAKEKIAKTCYYKAILKAMEKAEKEDEEKDKYMLQRMKEEYGNEDDARRGYDDWRYSDGRFAPKGKGHKTRRGYEDMLPDMYTHDYMADHMTPEQMRDVDRNMGKMYYSSGNMGNSVNNDNMGNSSTRGYSDGYNNGIADGRNNIRSTSRYENAKRGYSETKEMHKGNSKEDKDMHMSGLEKFMSVISEDVRELKPSMSQEERSLASSKLMTMAESMK